MILNGLISYTYLKLREKVLKNHKFSARSKHLEINFLAIIKMFSKESESNHSIF